MSVEGEKGVLMEPRGVLSTLHSVKASRGDVGSRRGRGMRGFGHGHDWQ